MSKRCCAVRVRQAIVGPCAEGKRANSFLRELPKVTSIRHAHAMIKICQSLSKAHMVWKMGGRISIDDPGQDLGTFGVLTGNLCAS